MYLISKQTITINESGVTLQDKYPDLVGSPKTLLFNMNGMYQAVIGYNQTSDNLYLTIQKDGKVVQGMTDLLEFPYNLFLQYEFLDYFLFYKGGTFYFGRYEEGDRKFNKQINPSLLTEFDNEIL